MIRCQWPGRLGIVLATCKPESRSNLEPTKRLSIPALQISDADRRRKLLITNKLTMTFNLKR